MLQMMLAPLWVRLSCYIVLMSALGAGMVGLLWLHNPLTWNSRITLYWPWVAGAVVALGIVLGIVLTNAISQSLAKFAETLQGLSPAQQRAAYRAAHRGPAPQDPVVRLAALRICEALRPPEGRAAMVFVAVLTIAALAQVPVFAVAVASGYWRESLLPGLVLAATGLAAVGYVLNIRRFQRQYQVLATAHQNAGLNVV